MNISLLKYINNSCYLDSVLMCILYNPSKVLYDCIFQKNLDNKIDRYLRDELYNLSKYISQSGKTVNIERLRLILSKIKNGYTFHTSKMQDASEFLYFLFDIFDFRTVNMETIIYFSNKIDSPPTKGVKTTHASKKISPIVKIDVFKLLEKREICLDDYTFIRSDDILDKPYTIKGKNYTKKILIDRILSSEYLVFYVDRLYKNRYIDKEVNFSLNIQKLQLKGIVLYRNYHYTAVLNIDNHWYYYDDTKSRLKKIDNILDNDYIQRNSILFFYN